MNFTDDLIQKVSKLLTNEEKAKLMIWVREIELIKSKKDSDLKEEKRVIKRSERDQLLFINTVMFDIIAQRQLKGKAIQRYEPQRTLINELIPAHKSRTGIITMFQKAAVIGYPGDAISYYLNKRGRKSKYGEFVGFIYTEIPIIPSVKSVTIYLVKEPAIEKRKKLRASRRKHGVSALHYDTYLKHNTLRDFAEGKEILTPKERNKRENIRREKRLKKLKEQDINSDRKADT